MLIVADEKRLLTPMGSLLPAQCHVACGGFVEEVADKDAWFCSNKVLCDI